MATILSSLKWTGFVINLKKSSVEPTQDLVFLRAGIQTAQDAISLPFGKAEDIADMVSSFRVNKSYTARRWLQLLGVMEATITMTRFAQLRMRQLRASGRYTNNHGMSTTKS